MMAKKGKLKETTRSQNTQIGNADFTGCWSWRSMSEHVGQPALSIGSALRFLRTPSLQSISCKAINRHILSSQHLEHVPMSRKTTSAL